MSTETIIQINVPAAGESVTEAIIGSWVKEDGDYVYIDEVIVELESDKATMELPAESSGKIKILVDEGEVVPVGHIIAEIDTSAEAPIKEKGLKKEQEKSINTTSSKKDDNKQNAILTSPAANKIIKEHELNPELINGTGKSGRITKQDVLLSLNTPHQIKNTSQALFSRNSTSKKMSPIRKTISRRLVASKNETAMLTTFNEVDMSEIIEVRTKYKKIFFEKHGGTKLGFMSFFIKACTIALNNFPVINAQVDEESIIYNDFSDISIAVSTAKGLVVPVIRNAESLSILELEQEVARLAEKGRQGKLSLDEMEGGTFTITNGGVFGSLVSTPIINQPQSAILGMHAIQERPIAKNGEVIIKPMMYIALSYDHRIIDGKDSVSFLVNVKNLLENPENLLYGKSPIESLLEL